MLQVDVDAVCIYVLCEHRTLFIIYSTAHANTFCAYIQTHSVLDSTHSILLIVSAIPGQVAVANMIAP